MSASSRCAPRSVGLCIFRASENANCRKRIADWCIRWFRPRMAAVLSSSGLMVALSASIWFSISSSILSSGIFRRSRIWREDDSDPFSEPNTRCSQRMSGLFRRSASLTAESSIGLN